VAKVTRKKAKAKSGKASARQSAAADEPVRREVEIVDNAPFEENEDLESDPNEKLDEEAYEAAKQIDEKLLSDEDITLPLPPPVVAAKTARKVDAEVIEPDSKGLKPAADPIATYLAEIRRYPLLTKEQEHELAIRYRETGDAMAAERLVTSNLRFVVKIAAEYSRFGAKLIDLVQEGNVGLMHAVKEFNPYKGVRLITYAVWWIRGYIQEYLMRQYSLVRIGTTQNQRKLFYRLQKEQQKLNAVGREPDYALLAGRLGVTPEEVETMTKRLSGRDVSLSAPVDDENPGSSLLDFEEAPGQAIDVSIGNEEELTVLRQNIEKIRDSLSEKELYILANRILSDEPQTLQEIGEHYGVTREAVRQLEARLIGKIRKAVTSDLHYEDTED
jgi:RNA polymerase sigma-32 factor